MVQDNKSKATFYNFLEKAITIIFIINMWLIPLTWYSSIRTAYNVEKIERMLKYEQASIPTDTINNDADTLKFAVYED